VYARAGGGETLLVIFNPAETKAAAEFAFPVEHQKLKLLAGSEVHSSKEGARLTIEVPGRAYAIYAAVK
jgi:hypothetical protein